MDDYYQTPFEVFTPAGSSDLMPVVSPAFEIIAASPLDAPDRVRPGPALASSDRFLGLAAITWFYAGCLVGGLFAAVLWGGTWFAVWATIAVVLVSMLVIEGGFLWVVKGSGHVNRS